MKSDIARIQRKLGVAADGIVGPVTVQALLHALQLDSNTTASPAEQWPTQAEVRSGRSIFGAAGCEHELLNLIPPYPLFYEGQQVRTIRLHRLIAAPVQDALREVLAYYGQEEIERLGLNLYGGSYNYRNTTGGKSLSMHAWGIALDFSPAANACHMRAPRATLSHPDCEAWWQIWERHGATSMGRARGYDWMHLQFARL